MTETEALKVFQESGALLGRSFSLARVQETLRFVQKQGGKVVAVAMIVDRSNGEVDFGVPGFSLIKLKVESFPPDKLPPDLATIPAIKPGSG